MNLPTSDGVYFAVGLQGSGKTYFVHESVFAHVRAGRQVVMLDRTVELRNAGVPDDVADVTVEVSSIDEARDAFGQGYRLAVRSGSFDELVAEQACALAIEVQGGVAIPEAHRVAPNGSKLAKALPTLDDCVTMVRHLHVAVWLDTQRLAKLNTDLTELATEIRVFAVSGRNDKAALRELGDDDDGDLVKLATEANRRRLRAKARKEAGDPNWHEDAGWHVLLNDSPYQLRRL